MKILVTGDCYPRKDLEKLAGYGVRFFGGLSDGEKGLGSGKPQRQRRMGLKRD